MTKPRQWPALTVVLFAFIRCGGDQPAPGDPSSMDASLAGDVTPGSDVTFAHDGQVITPSDSALSDVDGAPPPSSDGPAPPGDDGAIPPSGDGATFPSDDATAPPGDAGPAAIDWTPWSIQEPDGTSQRSLAGYRSAWFYPDGAYQAFMDPQTGKTTPGSKHPRSELHETSLWTSSGTNTLNVTGRVTKSGSGPICIGQVFCNDGDNGGHTLAELGYQTSGFSVYIEEGGTDPTTGHNLGGAIGLNSTFSYKMEYSGGKLTITANGQTLIYTPSAAAQSGHFYFKCGDYDQSATSGPVSATPYSIVKILRSSFLTSKEHLEREGPRFHPLADVRVAFVEMEEARGGVGEGARTHDERVQLALVLVARRRAPRARAARRSAEA